MPSPVTRAELTYIVTADDTALAVGSGSLPVLGTPRLLAWCEAATCAALDGGLEAGSTSVGTRITWEHRAASAVGATVRVVAEETHRDGRLVRLSVLASDSAGKVLGTGEITRVVVDAERFLARIDRT